MVSTCCICSARSWKPGKSRFTVPKDAERRKKWEEALKFNLKIEHKVCGNHFENEDIQLEKLFLDKDGKVVGVGKYLVPVLKKDAVPISIETTNQIHEEIEEKQLQEEIEEQEEIESTCITLFDAICEKIAIVNLPLFWFEISCSDNWNWIIFTKYVSQGQDDLHAAIRPIPFKELCITRDGSVIFNCFGKQIHYPDLPKTVTDIDELQKALLDFNELCFCPGAKADETILERAWKDNKGTVRHEACPVISQKQKMCNFCTSLQKCYKNRLTKKSRRFQMKVALLQRPAYRRLQRLQTKTKWKLKALRGRVKEMKAYIRNLEINNRARDYVNQNGVFLLDFDSSEMNNSPLVLDLAFTNQA